MTQSTLVIQVVVGNVMNMQDYLVTEAARYSIKDLKLMKPFDLWAYHDTLLKLLKGII